MSTKTQILSDYQLNGNLKKYVSDEIQKCDEQMRECKLILTSDSDDIITEDRMEAHRNLEIIQFRRFWLYEQMDALLGKELNNYINRKNG